jgi:hypothetical protein
MTRFAESLLALPALALLAAGVPAQCANLGGPACGVQFPPTISCAGSPTVGNMAFKVTSTIYLPPGPVPVVLLVGNCASPAPTFSHPAFCTASFPCMPTAFVDLSLFFPVNGVSPAFFQPVEFPLPIENDPAFVGFTLCAQAVGLSAYLTGAPCIAVSNGISITFLP